MAPHHPEEEKPANGQAGEDLSSRASNTSSHSNLEYPLVQGQNALLLAEGFTGKVTWLHTMDIAESS